jgi:hypothetical protein
MCESAGELKIKFKKKKGRGTVRKRESFKNKKIWRRGRRIRERKRKSGREGEF